MSLILNGLVRWAEIYPEETKASIATTIKTKDILRRIAEPCEITCGNWRGQGSLISFYISVQDYLVTQELSFTKEAPLGQHWVPSM